MKSQFSFGLAVLPVSVTKQDIANGISRSCTGCAIARALNRTLPRFGFRDCHVRLIPYTCWADADGLEIYTWDEKLVGRLEPHDLPKGLIDWAMDFDDWAEFMDSYGGSKREWREAKGSEYPFRPEPITFIFNFGQLDKSEPGKAVDCGS